MVTMLRRFFSGGSLDQVQLRATRRIIVMEGAMSRGEVFWTSGARARSYIDQGVAEPIVPPAAAAAAGVEPQEKKFSGAVPPQASTASPSSSAAGAAPQPSVLPAGPASPPARPRRSKRRKSETQPES
jgi:hypothetical protein